MPKQAFIAYSGITIKACFVSGDILSAMHLTIADIKKAQSRISNFVLRTPLIKLPLGGEVYCKAENMQKTNSFKIRGAFNFLSSLSPEERKKGVTAPSSGNHAQALACAAHHFGVPAAIAIPHNAPHVKVEATKAWGAEVVRCGGSTKERQAASQYFVKERGYHYVPPFDHPMTIAGQGTIGLEILEDMADVNNILVPTGGGGLLAGISLAVKSINKNVKVYGVEPEIAADVTESFNKRRRIEWPAEKTTKTIADGVRTQQVGELNFEIIKDNVDGFLTVSEGEIIDAARFYLLKAKIGLEPTGALTLAAYLRNKEILKGKAVLIISGGNFDPEFIKQLLS